jgi:Rps23 Pro-64 3,4-dihydroxylase Tpa1-like proline 4-hydroxylase
MELINMERLNAEAGEIKIDYQSKKPYRYVVFENFFYPDKVETIHSEYPEIKGNTWDGIFYMDAINKFAKTQFEPGSVMAKVFSELNSKEFLMWLENITGIDDILGDSGLIGGGLHQSTNGAYLNVHVDFNIHHITKFHRRLNVLVYMNKDWKDEYEGHLELWDLTGGDDVLLNKVAPVINRCVIFETNEISFHGHPKPLNTPVGVNRKSIATYYYTESRPASEIAPDHSTIYVNTEGITGHARRLSTRVKIFLKKINSR